MNNSSRVHLPSLLQLAISGLGLLASLPAALILFVLAIGGRVTGRTPLSETISFLSLATVALVISLLLLPSAALAIFHLLGRQPPAWHVAHPFRLASYLLLLWPAFLGLGWAATHVSSLVWLLPPLQVLAIGVPIWWLIELGRHNLVIGSPQRAWGVLSFGLVVNPPLILLLELLVLVALVVAAAIWISGQPDLANQASQLFQQLQRVGRDPQRILDLVQPYLAQPITAFVALAVGALLMPMLEEFFKPLVLWFITPGSDITPAQGFVVGLISGGAFAMMESLTLVSNISDASWVGVVAGRLGTGLLHTTTSGLMGWALVLALKQGRYLRLGLTYLAAVGLHGLWNTSGLLLGLASLQPDNTASQGLLSRVDTIAPVAMVLLAVVLFVILLGANRQLQRAASPGDVYPGSGENRFIITGEGTDPASAASAVDTSGRGEIN